MHIYWYIVDEKKKFVLYTHRNTLPIYNYQLINYSVKDHYNNSFIIFNSAFTCNSEDLMKSFVDFVFMPLYREAYFIDFFCKSCNIKIDCHTHTDTLHEL